MRHSLTFNQQSVSSCVKENCNYVFFAKKNEPELYHTNEGIEYYIESREAIITRCAVEGGELKIPEYIDGCPVVEIADSAFYESIRLCGTVDVPCTVRKIGDYAFGSNVCVKEFVLHDGLEEIGEFAFTSCENLRKIHIPDTALTLEDTIFSGCHRLAEVRVPRMLTALPYGMFMENYSLDRIELPESIKVIGDNAFAFCIGLEAINLETVEKIGVCAFEECVMLENVNFGVNLTEIGIKAFKRCYMLRYVNIPSGTAVGKKAFFMTGVRI